MLYERNRWAARLASPILLWRYIVGAVAGIADLANNLPLRNRIGGVVLRDGSYLDGFDLTSDLYRFRPTWLWRRWIGGR